jgi:undecaprenyl-diphosphatase
VGGGWRRWVEPWRKRAGRWALLETRALLVLLVVAAAGWIFAEVADEVIEGETRALDSRILLAMRVPGDPADPVGPPWLEEAGRDITALGGMTVLAVLTAAVAGLLWLQRHRSTMVFLVVAVAGGMLATSLIKAGFDRPRPDLVPHGMHVVTASFPSGHSMQAAVTYLTLAVLSARVQSRWVIKVYLIALAALLTVAVGISRVYLGVHWPTDVVAGWCAGAVWALSCWLVARGLARRGAVEPESSGALPARQEGGPQ